MVGVMTWMRRHAQDADGRSDKAGLDCSGGNVDQKSI